MADMFLRKFILYETNVQIILRQQNYFGVCTDVFNSLLREIILLKVLFCLVKHLYLSTKPK